MNVLVSGATGFVGKPLVSNLLLNDNQVKAIVRKLSDGLSSSVEQIVAGDLAELSLGSPSASLSKTLREVDILVHIAARVHVMHDDASYPLLEFRKVNSDATLVLAQLAADAGVKRFVFLSSIKVNGEMTKPGHPFKPEDEHIPDDPYGLSKYEAEQGLLALSKETGMEVVIIRPPLVYGPGVKANFAAMMKWISKGIPLPLGAVNNKRSLVGLDNLVSFIIHCIGHPKAANEVFLISDGEDISTTVLIKKVAKAFDKKAWLLPIPVSWMTFVAKLVGKADVTERLFGSLQVDSSKARDLLGWKPVVTMDEQLKKIAETYPNNEKNF